VITEALGSGFADITSQNNQTHTILNQLLELVQNDRGTANAPQERLPYFTGMPYQSFQFSHCTGLPHQSQNLIPDMSYMSYVLDEPEDFHHGLNLRVSTSLRLRVKTSL
jgi:hypothetical protein